MGYRRRRKNSPAITAQTGTTMLGSGTLVPPSRRTTLSKPFSLSVDGSALRNAIVVDDPVAVNEVVNCCHVCLPVVVLLLVKAPSSVPLIPPSRTSTVLVVP